MANSFIKKNYRRIILWIVIVAAIYGIVPQLGDFKGSLAYVKNADFPVWAVVAMFCTYIFAAGTLKFLAFHPLSLSKTAIMQMASTAVNRVLPSGSGAIGMNAAYLYKQGHTGVQAGVIASLKNILGGTAHGTLLLIVVFVLGYSLGLNNLVPKNPDKMAVAIVVSAVIFVVLAFLVIGKKPILRLFRRAGKQLAALLANYKKRPLHVAGALLTEACVSLSYTFCLWQSLHAVGLTAISLPAAFILITLATAGGTAIPTPGGLGGTEAAIYGGLIAMGQDPKMSLAGALLFRLVSYWLPLIIGAAALIYVTKRNYYTFTPKKSTAKKISKA